MIDSHQHFWLYSPASHGWITDSMPVLKRNFLPEDLKKELDARNLAGCVAVQASSSVEETLFLLELANRHPFIRGVVGWLDLMAPDLGAKLAAFKGQNKLVALRHGVQDEKDPSFLKGAAFRAGVKAVLDAGLAYDILIYPPQLPAALDFAEAFPGGRLVLDHLAKPYVKDGKMEPWATNIFELGSLPHVYCKISGMVTEAAWGGWKPEEFRPYWDTVLQAFGPERLMYGSDWPVCLLSGSYGQVFDLASSLAAELSPAEQQGFFGLNAEKFYKLPA